MEQHAKGCKLSSTDIRDYKVKAPGKEIKLPESFKWGLENVTIKDQGSVCSCVAHASSSILEFHNHNKNALSTNFIYGFEEAYEPGMSLRMACEIMMKYGDPSLPKCPGNYERPYAHGHFLRYINQSDLAVKQASTIKSYYMCADEEAIKYAIYTYGPVLAGVDFPTDYTLDRTGNIRFNKAALKQEYHAIMIYGWDKTGFWCVNSWGKSWGKNGCFHFNYGNGMLKEARALVPGKFELQKDKYLVTTKAADSKNINIVYKMINKVLNIFKN